MTLISNQDIQIAICRAVINWHEWSDCFENPGNVRTLAVMVDEDRFSKFCQEYGLHWIGGEAQRRQFLDAMRNSNDFQFAVRHKSEKRLAKAMNTVKDSFGRRQLSAISKLAAFAVPSYFVAFDRYSRMGAAQLACVPLADLEFYPRYLNEVQKLLNSYIGDGLRECIKRHPSSPSGRYREAFLRRVLDCLLMKLGGRWSS